MQVGLSPCPNDTYLFHHWIQKGGIDPQFADIHHLNELAKAGTYPLCKVSFHCLGHILDDYVMLPTGAALGHGCGPKIVAREPFSLDQLGQRSIAIPGPDTTAHLLLQILAPEPQSKHFCLYNQVEDSADCALIIHEQRFTFEQRGFVEIADLGELWEEKFGAPIPLGGVVVKRSLGKQAIEELIDELRESLHAANDHVPMEYILEHSIEKDPLVVQQHIDTYITSETDWLSDKGIYAVEVLLHEGRKRGLIPPSDAPWRF